MSTRYLLAAPVVVGLTLLLVLPSPAAEAPTKEKIDRLIDKMGSGDFSEREQASKELAAIGAPALEALRKAAKSGDAEVRKRAEELLPKIERQAESVRLLASKRVHLVYKDTPLSEAVADFRKKSGYSMELHDPDGKLKERKITLDTGETSFWHALVLFCAKADVEEVSMADLMQAAQGQQGGARMLMPPLPPQFPVPAGGKPAAQPAVGGQKQMMPGMAGMPASNAQFVLKDGKPKKLPTDDRTAIRIRALAKSDLFGKTPEDETILPLEVTLEPKLQWEALQSIRIDKAVDDREQTLSQVIPQVEGVVGAVGGAAGAQQMQMMMQQQMIRQRQMMMMQMRARGVRFPTMAGIPSQQAPVQLKKGAQEAKLLKELKGVISANVLGEAQPLIVADKLKAGESFQGKEGGFIKILEVKAQDEETTIRLEFEQPPFEKVLPAQQNVMRGIMGGGAAPLRIQAVPVKKLLPPRPAPAPAAPPPPALGAKQQQAPLAPAMPIQVAIGGGGGAGFGGMPIMSSFNGLSVLDEKGNALLMQTQTRIQVQQQAGGVFKQTTSYTLTCRRDKDKGQPAKIVFLGRKRVTVEIPFTLKDVPLPK